MLCLFVLEFKILCYIVWVIRYVFRLGLVHVRLSLNGRSPIPCTYFSLTIVYFNGDRKKVNLYIHLRKCIYHNILLFHFATLKLSNEANSQFTTHNSPFIKLHLTTPEELSVYRKNDTPLLHSLAKRKGYKTKIPEEPPSGIVIKPYALGKRYGYT